MKTNLIVSVLRRFAWLGAKLLKSGNVSYPFGENPCKYEVLEETLSPTVRFLTSLNISCCSWLELQLKAGNFKDRSSQGYLKKEKLQDSFNSFFP